MVLDTSIDARQLSDSVEKNREHRILCVPDYSDDIYKHIREMEGPAEGFMTIGNGNMPLSMKPIKSAFSIPDDASSTQGFTIHMDDQSENMPKPTLVDISRDFAQQPRLQLHSGITSLRPPLATVENPIVVEDSPASLGSPMVLDTSIDARQVTSDARQVTV